MIRRVRGRAERSDSCLWFVGHPRSLLAGDLIVPVNGAPLTVSCMSIGGAAFGGDEHVGEAVGVACKDWDYAGDVQLDAVLRGVEAANDGRRFLLLVGAFVDTQRSALSGKAARWDSASSAGRRRAATSSSAARGGLCL